MDLFNLNILKSGWIRQLKFLFSSPERAQEVILWSETGAISLEPLPIHTGFVTSNTTKRAWMVIHALKFAVYKDGQPWEDKQVLLISERNYKPLDPNGSMKKEDVDKLASLTDIAKLKHAEARAAAGRSDDQSSILDTIVVGCFLIDGLYGIIWAIMRFITNKGAGG